MSAEGSTESGKPTVEKKEARRTSRRDFLCLGAGLAVGAAAAYLAMPQPSKETFNGKGATKVKITVLRVLSPPDIYPEGLPVKKKLLYGGTCPYFDEGMEFYVDAERPQRPPGLPPSSGYAAEFCIYAWQAIFPVAWKYYESDLFSGWYENPRVTVMPCPDGLNPVIFKLEWI